MEESDKREIIWPWHRGHYKVYVDDVGNHQKDTKTNQWALGGKICFK